MIKCIKCDVEAEVTMCSNCNARMCDDCCMEDLMKRYKDGKLFD